MFCFEFILSHKSLIIRTLSFYFSFLEIHSNIFDKLGSLCILSEVYAPTLTQLLNSFNSSRCIYFISYISWFNSQDSSFPAVKFSPYSRTMHY